MLQNARELCTLIIRDLYGDVSSKVVDVLLEYGRNSIPHLVRKVRLPEKVVRQTLVVLIQQHLVLYCIHGDGGVDTVYYECDWHQIYELLHVGKIIQIVEERFGVDGASVISNFLQLGHARVSDFLSAYSTKDKKGALNGISNSSSTLSTEATGTSVISSANKIKALLVKLMQEKFLIQVFERHMQPQTDTDNALRKKFKAELSGAIVTQIKLNREVEQRLEEYKAELENAAASEHAGMKRKSSGLYQDKPRKRAKLSMYDEGVTEEWDIDDEIVLRVNHFKIFTILRNAELVSWANQRLSYTTSVIYAEFLRKLEKHYHSPRDYITKKLTCTTHDIAKTLDPNLQIDDLPTPPVMTNGTGKKRPYVNGNNSSKSGRKGHGAGMDDGENIEEEDEEGEEEEDEEEEDDGFDDDDDMNEDDAQAAEKRRRMERIQQHMRLLAENTFHFVASEGNRQFGEWSIDFPKLVKTIRTYEMDKIIEERHGTTATRLVRIIRDKGKLDEKQVATISLLKQKDIRAHLSGLHERGHLQIQEVPKSNDRAPSRTLYLFYYDDERAQRTVLHDIYKCISRVIQRIMHERNTHSIVLSKAERTDVQANEELLTKKEHEEIKKWKSTEEKLLTQMARLDRQVMLFRDW